MIDKDALGVREALIHELSAGKTISESYAKRLDLVQDFLTEDVSDLKTKSDVPDRAPKTTRSEKGTDYYLAPNGTDIYVPKFVTIWKDPDHYGSLSTILSEIGLKRENWTNDRSAKQFLSDLAAYATTNDFMTFYCSFSERQKYYGANGLVKQFNDLDDADQADIDAGTRVDNSKTGKTVKKINDDDVLPGSLYSNMTLIPRSTWTSWIKFWDRNKTSVLKNNGINAGKWQKSFILGYRIDQNDFYEIWYNSIDSTFTIHDRRGTQLTRRYPTIQETMKALFEFIKLSTPQQDADVLKNFDNTVASSIGRALSSDVATSDRLQTLKKQEERSVRSRKRMKEIRSEGRRRAKQQLQTSANDRAQAAQDAERAKYGYEDAADVGQREEDDSKAQRDANRRRVNNSANGRYGQAKRRENDAYGYEDIADVGQRDGSRSSGSSEASDEDYEEQVRKAQEYYTKKRQEQKRTASVDESHSDPIDFLSVLEAEGLDSSENQEDVEKEIASEVKNLANDQTFKAAKQNLKKKAVDSQYTTRLIKNNVLNNVLEIYRQTRLDQSDEKLRFSTILSKKFSVFRGRKAPIQSPSKIFTTRDSDGSYQNSFFTSRYIADFIIGFSLKDKVNIEVWYITEANPDYSAFFSNSTNSVPKFTSSYYVYDATSKTLIRSHLPHYRNAVQVALNKIAPIY